MVSVTACLAQGGEPQGDQSNCASVSCPQPPERAHPGWNWVDVGVMLTKNQPAYWSALTGQPGPGGSAVSPFTIVDPSLNPLQQGRPALDGTTDRVLRGFVYAWAVDAFNREISWNHLKGDATIVNYRDGAAWEYNAWAFQVVAPVAHGVHTGITPGQLDLDGVEYVPGFAQLQLDFYAAGSSALSGGSGPFAGDLVTDTELVLHPIVADLRQETVGPITTKANFVIWNEDETQLTGLHRCITCWDQTLISLYAGFNNHFLLSNLQTDKGRARIDGIASQQCDFLPPFEDSSVSVSLLGVAAKHISFASGARLDSAGTNLIGMGIEPQVAAIQYDLGSGPPPTLVDPDSGGRPALQPRGGRGLSLADSNMMMSESIAATPDRVSGSEKGSLLVFSKVEIRWDELGNVVQDTFLDISNDFPADVQVQMYFINGDPPLDATDSLTLEEPTTPQELLPWLIEQVDRSIKRYKQE